MARKQKWNWQEALVGRTRSARKKPFPTLSELEQVHIAEVVEAYGDNLAHAALALGVSRSTLYRKLDISVAKRSKKRVAAKASA